MANKKISELTSVITLPDAALITAVDLTRAAGDQNVKIAKSDLITGGGAVDSVNSQTGVVVLDTDDIADTATNRYTNDTDVTRLANTSGTNTGNEEGDRGTITNVIPITNIAGSNYNFNTANGETAYTVTRNNVINQFAQVFINTLTKPTLTLSGVAITEIGGSGWVANTDLYLYVRDLGVDGIHYSFLPKAVGSVGGGVETVTGTAVDNTDPLNPIINSATFNLTVADSVATSVSNVDDISFGAGFTVTNDGGGQAGVTFSGGALPFLNIEDAPYNCVADALGDAGVDSTVGFELALSDLVTAGGGTLIIPDTPGLRFNIGVLTATTRDLSNCTITSYGTGSIFVKATVGGGQGRGVLINLADGTNNFTIEKLDVLASSGCFRSNFETGIICSQAGNLSNITIRDNKLGNESKALTAIGVDGITFFRVTNTADVDLVTDLLIENNEIDLYGISVYGIQLLREVQYPKIRDNTVYLRSWTETVGQVYNAIAVYGDSKYFEVTGNKVLGSGHSAIAISQASNGCVKNNFVFNCINSVEAGIEVEYKAGHGTDTFQSNSVVIRDNYVENCEYGIWVTERNETATTLAPYNILIDGNTIKDSLDIDIFIASNINTTSERTSLIENVTISNNYCSGTASNGGIRVYDGKNIKILNNVIKSTSLYGIALGRDTVILPEGDILISGNSVTGFTNFGIWIESADRINLIISENTTEGGIRGIYCNTSMNASLTSSLQILSNVVKSASSDNMRITSTALTFAIISNNVALDGAGQGFELNITNGLYTNNVSRGCATADVYGGTGSVSTNNLDL